MIMNDKKKLMTILVSKRDPKTGEEKSRTHGMQPESDSSDESGLHSASEDLIAAVHEKSAHKVKDAMKSFILQHGNLSKKDE